MSSHDQRRRSARSATCPRGLVLLALLAASACGRLSCSPQRHRAIAHVNAGVRAFAEGQLGAAQRELEQAVEQDSTLAVALANLAKVYQQLGRWELAQARLAQLVALEPGNARAFYELGKALQKLQRLEEAQAAYQRALSLSPNLYVAHYESGTLHEALGQPKEADAAYRRAIQINAHFDKPFVKLGRLYLKHDYAELAMQVLQAGAAVNEASAEIHDFLGLAYQQLKHFDRAIESFRRALELEPDRHVALFNLGMAYAEADRRALAERTLTRFTELAGSSRTIGPEYRKAASEKIIELHEAQLGAPQPPAKLQ
ncbi:MAG: tetratricopeptide repeat protein [Proteobacteria bacterium]|nr:tetratricopeptide repeat protein [Pseudomonadota bacterium]